MPLVPLKFTNQTYYNRNTENVGQRLINAYLELNPEKSVSPYTLYSRYGLDLYKEVDDKPIKNVKLFNDCVYYIQDTTLLKMDKDCEIETVYEQLNGSVFKIEITNIEMFIVTNTGHAYIVANDDTVTVVTSDLPVSTPTGIASFDGYFFVHKGQSFYGSEPLDGSEWDGLFVFSASEMPDNIVKIVPFNNALWVFGQNSIELFYNTGGDNASVATATFQQVSGAVNVTVGCGAYNGVYIADNRLFWFGNDRIFYTAEGYTPKRISNHAIEHEIATYAVVDDLELQGFNYGGNKFVIATFPGVGKTWVYHLNYDIWYEWHSKDLERLIIKDVFEFNGKLLTTDYNKGIFYEINPNIYTDNGAAIQKVIDTPPIYEANNPIFFAEININIETGKALKLQDVQGYNPYLGLSYSDDGGYTFKNKRLIPIGKRGEYNHTAKATRLGMAKRRIFRIDYGEPTPFKISSINARLEVGNYG